MKIFQVKEIIEHLENSIKYRKPFNFIRWGDGGIKLIDSILNGHVGQLNVICKKEGLPPDKIISLFEYWGYYARQASYIDTPLVYFNNTFWPRIKKPGKCINENTKIKMLNWTDLYYRAEFDNENYCNPELNYLMVLRRDGFKNILDIMKGRKIALITAVPEVKPKLKDFDIDIIKIVKHYENQYENSFQKVMKFIKYNSNIYDMFIVAAGELGRIYTGYIKECGGRAVDLGFIIEYWVDGYLHPRLKYFMDNNINNRLELVLTNEGKKYEQYI